MARIGSKQNKRTEFKAQLGVKVCKLWFHHYTHLPDTTADKIAVIVSEVVEQCLPKNSTASGKGEELDIATFESALLFSYGHLVAIGSTTVELIFAICRQEIRK
jgi:hypothetical protein